MVDTGDGVTALRLRGRAGGGCRRKQISGVDQPLEQPTPGLRVGGEHHDALSERDERGGEIAAVHGGHVPGAERRQRRGVVPIQEVPFMALQPFERRDRAIETMNQLLGRQVSEIVRGQRRQKRHADVGGGGARGQVRRGSFLVVVGRQPRVGVRDEGLVVSPRLPSGPAEQQPLAIGEWALARPHRHAQPVRDTWRDRPQAHEWHRRGQRLGARDGDQ